MRRCDLLPHGPRGQRLYLDADGELVVLQCSPEYFEVNYSTTGAIRPEPGDRFACVLTVKLPGWLSAQLRGLSRHERLMTTQREARVPYLRPFVDGSILFVSVAGVGALLAWLFDCGLLS